jgi:hypothetical protein
VVKTDQIEIWNLTDGKIARSGCVDIFNIVGRVADPASIEKFAYQLNDGPEVPVCFTRTPEPVARLRQPGDFNIDTIALADLRPENRLSFSIKRTGGSAYRHAIRFRTAPFECAEPRFRLELNGASGAEEVGQVVEGPWRVGEDEQGRRCLEIVPEDAGYDRIILFGREDWTSGYEVRARLAVTRIVDRHNIGLVFKWNPHERGDGTWLPKKWSSGLGYYCSYGEHPGIRIRFGVQAHYDEAGQIRGNYLLAHCPLTTRRQVLFNRIKEKARLARWTTELQEGREYSFRMVVQPRRLALAVWLADSAEPPPQLLVDDPIDPLSQGAAGILAYQVGVRLYEFEVRPLSDSPVRSAVGRSAECTTRRAAGEVGRVT